MKCITICQPYADLVLLPESHPEHKRSENRKWPSPYRGPLLIHAGKSRSWLERDEERPGHDVYGLRLADMVFGAILGTVEMVACLAARDIRAGNVPSEFRWLRDHRHVEGPFCHIYRNPRRFARPIPYEGALMHFDVPDALVARWERDQAAARPEAPGLPAAVPGVPKSLFDTPPTRRWS